MIDTTSINYALSKISEGWQKAAPTLQNVGEKYVHYVVMREVVGFALVILAIFAWAVFFRVTFRKAWAFEDDPRIGCVLVYGIPTLLLTVFFFLSAYCTAMALLNPEMYTVQSVIDAARGK